MTDHDSDSNSGTETLSRDRVKTDKPRMFKVIMLNDDYTSMDFVVVMLESVFRKNPAEAVQIMLHVHQKGRGICGIFTKEIAETKIAIVHDRARAENYPLRCTMEPE